MRSRKRVHTKGGWVDQPRRSNDFLADLIEKETPWKELREGGDLLNR